MDSYCVSCGQRREVRRYGHDQGLADGLTAVVDDGYLCDDCAELGSEFLVPFIVDER